jgi:hypothetical protein
LARIQILIAGMPQFLADVIRASLLEHADMQLIDETCSVNHFLSAGNTVTPDVVIVGLDDASLPSFCQPLLYGNPHMKVLAVSMTGNGTALYELRPHRIALGNVTPTGLVDAIRALPTVTK